MFPKPGAVLLPIVHMTKLKLGEHVETLGPSWRVQLLRDFAGRSGPAGIDINIPHNLHPSLSQEDEPW